ncbi:Uncharacterised protein [Yersinia massiliensis]|uniref:hypothetical protein n=1 Tax=Yersinia massiliensis TaxID=419257 RepID=UPI0005DD71C6|nr:hypothetical protein [Yersinia massiliensis]CNI16360.1 Uncharacterised protein [Yersinia massiliensis]
MKIKMINYTFAIYAIAISFLLLISAWFGIPAFFLRDSLNIYCVSSYSAPSLPEKTSANGTLLIRLGKNNKGSFSISGTLNQEGNNPPTAKKLILREVIFDYAVEGNGFITIHNTKLTRSASDKISDEFFNQNVWDLSRLSRQLKIIRIKNAWLFGSSFSPTVMCVNKI